MRYTAVKFGLGVALVAGSLVGAAGPATAGTGSTERLYAPSALVLTIANGQDPAHATVQRAALLSCAPTPGGDHPSAADACAAIDGAKGDFTALTGDSDRMCTLIHSPVVVAARGVWKGKTVEYQETFSNACVMRRDRGDVFSF